MSSELREIKSFFDAKNITLSDEWLSHCLSWFKEEHANYTQTELQSQVYEQWLLHDFRDVKVPILPPNANKEKKLVLNQSVCLQLQFVIDISKPKLLQIQTIRNPKNQSNNTDENTASGKRLLQLTLTDGLQEITATEYRPVKALNINLSPGIKVKLNAPITIRRGTVMLTENSIKILGGEVEELFVENAAENVLAKILGLPLSDNPTVMRETLATADTEVLGNRLPGTSLQPVRTKNLVPNKAANQASINQFFKPKSEPELFGDDFSADFDAADFDEIDPPKPEPVKQSALFETGFDSDEYEEMMQMDVKFEEPTPKQEQRPMERKAMPIANLQKIMGNVTKGRFMIDARFDCVTQKFMTTDNAFSIKICVKDDSGELVAAMHNDVISDMMGYDFEAIMEMRNKMRDGDTTIGQTISKTLSDFKEKLTNLDGKMDILVESQQDPTIVKLHQ